MASIKNRSMHVYLAQNKRHLEEGSERLKQQLEHIAELKRSGLERCDKPTTAMSAIISCS